jgi:hypothetical protein
VLQQLRSTGPSYETCLGAQNFFFPDMEVHKSTGAGWQTLSFLHRAPQTIPTNIFGNVPRPSLGGIESYYPHCILKSFEPGVLFVDLAVHASRLTQIVEHNVHIDIEGRHNTWCGMMWPHTTLLITERDSTYADSSRSVGSRFALIRHVTRIEPEAP